ncbi:hypothetical protein RDI58_004362 [Solanum bulbocastanum]|uniref:Uncharacterized protein n=1 Tax=Solanum bulbocastanum TaxID=147425 RepID=A0AAN8YLL4_SOLBU
MEIGVLQKGNWWRASWPRPFFVDASWYKLKVCIMVKVLQNLLKVSLKLIYLVLSSGVAAMLHGQVGKMIRCIAMFIRGFGIAFKGWLLALVMVASFTGEKHALEEYNKSLQNAYISGGSVLTITLAVLTASMSIGEAFSLLCCRKRWCFQDA